MHGKPVIGTNHGGIPEIVHEGENGHLVPQGDIRCLALALLDILTDEEKARTMGLKGYQMAIRDFGWEAATTKLLESYGVLPDLA